MTIRATWRNGRLAAKQLHDALKAAGLDPAAFVFTNLYGPSGSGSWWWGWGDASRLTYRASTSPTAHSSTQPPAG